VKKAVLILGAGFGGLELATLLSNAFGDSIDVTLLDRSDSFVFGFSKLDVLFGRAELDSVRHPYAAIAKPGVRFLQQTVIAIDPVARRVTTDAGVFESDILVVAMGVGYDVTATPDLASAGYEFYSEAGAERARDAIAAFQGGRVIVGVCGAPFKCPPAPSEAVLLLHDDLVARGIRDKSSITFVIPFPSPVPPSPDTSAALLSAFRERDITFISGRKVASLDGDRRVAILDDGEELRFDLFLGVPKHVVPEAVRASGLVDEQWISVNPRTLETRFPGVYAIGHVSFTGAPKAGVFAEDAARALATTLIAELGGGGEQKLYNGAGSCYIEFGTGRVARVDVDFFSGPKPTGTHHEASESLRLEKEEFGSTRRTRWFGRPSLPVRTHNS
jgi:sulfide:quinone oxidoreductase